MKNKYLWFAFVIALTVSGCHPQISKTSQTPPNQPRLINASYVLTDYLEYNLKYQIPKDEPIYVATFVNVNDLKDSSTLGRLMAEQVASRLTQKGYKVIELKLRNNSIFVQEKEGEFILSRDLAEIGKKYNLAAVVVGTYGIVGAPGKELGETYISARIVVPATNEVISAMDVGIPMTSSQQRSLMAD